MSKTMKDLPPWQNDDFQRTIELRAAVPTQLQLLCRLMNVTPHQLITDFMDNLSCGSWKREGRDEAKQKLFEYFVEQGYGREYFSEKEIRTIFRELDAVGMLYPHNAPQPFINEHTRWRENFHTWWFKKWYLKNSRTI